MDLHLVELPPIALAAHCHMNREDPQLSGVAVICVSRDIGSPNQKP